MTPETEPTPTNESSNETLGGTGAGAVEAPRRAGEPAPPGSAEGRARAFRERQGERRSLRRERVGVLLVIVIILLGVYAIVSARPFNPASNPSTPTPGTPIQVSLANPVVGNVTCGNGAIGYTERIVVDGSTQPIITGDIAVHVYEILDGDFIPNYLAQPNITSTSVCAGAPPVTVKFLWYVALTAPNGTVLLSYTTVQGWKSIGGAPWNIPVENGTAFVVVTGSSIHYRGLGLAVVGFSGGSSISGSVPL